MGRHVRLTDGTVLTYTCTGGRLSHSRRGNTPCGVDAIRLVGEVVSCDLTKAPRVSVIVATKDNLDTIGPCVLSILASTLPDFELIVVNQGNPRALEQALSAYAHDPRLRILHTNTRGLGAARNVGASAALSAYLCYTDGDCTVCEDWLADMLACMERYPRAGLVFGRVVAPPYDHAQYMVPVYDPPLGGVEWKETAYLGLMGANMGIRRAAYEAVGGAMSSLVPAPHWRQRMIRI